MSRRILLRGAAICLALALPLGTGALYGQDDGPTFKFNGQVRLRGELDGRTTGIGTDEAVLSRVRAGVNVGLIDWLGAYVQIQDVRAWGESFNTLTDASADNFDLHQGYLDLLSDDMYLRLGRQIYAIADQRLIGSVEWSNPGRSFDGVLGSGLFGDVTAQLYWMNLVERDSILVIGLDPQLNEGLDADGWLVGGFASYPMQGGALELTAVHDRKAITRESYTVNLRAHGKADNIIYDGAGAYQFGDNRSAFFLSGKAGWDTGVWSLAAQVDYLSGDEEGSDWKNAFNTLYATNHKFYGYMDYFLLLPAQTDGAGLVDFIARGLYRLPKQWQLMLDLHYFQTAKQRDGMRGLGFEADLVTRKPIVKYASLLAGFSIFVPQDLATQVIRAFEDGKETTYWGFVQFNVVWN
jgi:hypothetical protein